FDGAFADGWNEIENAALDQDRCGAPYGTVPDERSTESEGTRRARPGDRCRPRTPGPRDEGGTVGHGLRDFRHDPFDRSGPSIAFISRYRNGSRRKNGWPAAAAHYDDAYRAGRFQRAYR